MFKKFKKKHIIYASLLIGIFSLFMFSTIVYSAINGTVKISGNAYARVEADARITDFRLASSNNATSSYEEFGKNHIVTEVDLVDSSSSITYYVEVTNYGTSDVGIFDITGLPSGLNYSLKEYNLKDKICDSNGLCNTFIKKTFEIIFTSSSAFTGSVQLNFDIRPFFKISYINLIGNYPTEFLAGSQVSIDISYDYPEFAYAVGEDDFGYTYSDGIIHFTDVWCDVEIGSIVSKDFSYTGDVQTYKVKADGIYKIDLWGAQGGNDNGGLGGYTSGYIQLNAKDDLYFYVGSAGSASPMGVAAYTPGGYNGGGLTRGQDCCDRIFGSGGGSSDVRLISGSWDDFNSLKSRLMVAAGGGGGFTGEAWGGLISNGGVAGGLIGGQGDDTNWCAGLGGTQKLGGSISFVGEHCTSGNENYTDPGKVTGMFGIGGSHGEQGNNSTGGGGGYYGGSSSGHIAGAGGGSSFISWHEGCDAITESSTSSNIAHTGQSVHYSGYVFANTTMIDGDGYKWVAGKKGSSVVGMPKTDYSGIMTGNTENGYAKITPISMGKYHLVKYKYNDENLSNYSFVKNGEDLNVSFVDEYYAVLVKNKDGSVHSNYSYDRVNKDLVVNDITDDIEITLVRPFDVDVYFYTGGDQCIHNEFYFQNVYNEHFPITIDYYHKESYEDEYSLVETIEFTSEDDFDNWFYDCDTIAYVNYDVRIEFKANNGYVTSVEANVDTECFVAGTKVLVENGYKNIEDIQVGDYVYALDLDSNEKSLKQVTRKFEGLSNETYEIVVNGEKITATPKHEFYVIDKGWIRAYDLEVGDVLNSFNNGHLEITDIKYVMHSDPVKVYNLTVDGLHNYLISSDQLLVHNSMSFQ